VPRGYVGKDEHIAQQVLAITLLSRTVHMGDLLDVAHWLAVMLVLAWGIGIVGLASIAAALVRGHRRIVVPDPHEAAIFDAIRARRWDDAVAQLASAPLS
jgi:threonine dehydrogenase-like Zn-dependent dehydrogenase